MKIPGAARGKSFVSLTITITLYWGFLSFIHLCSLRPFKGHGSLYNLDFSPTIWQSFIIARHFLSVCWFIHFSLCRPPKAPFSLLHIINVMSYDRVLPKPPLLHHDSSHHLPLSRPTSNLLEHKIMNDDVAKVSMMDRHLESAAFSGHRRFTDTLPPVHLTSLNRSKVALNKVASNAASAFEAPKHTNFLATKAIPLRERSSFSERSSSSSPVKSSNAPTPRESATQFCLCQPDPKIPRPRNGMQSWNRVALLLGLTTR